MPAPVPPFTRETAIVKVRMAEDAWNSRDPHRVSLAYTEDSRWRNRAELGADGRGRDHLRGLGPVMSVTGGDPARILVVDDDPVTNRMVVDYPENRNLRAISASGRQEMARMLAVGEPRLVLLHLRPGPGNGVGPLA